MLHNVTLFEPHNKEKSYKKHLETQYSDYWRKHLEIVLSNPPGQVGEHLQNQHKRSMFRPASYLTHQSSPYQLELLQICTQHTIHIIPSHLQYAYQNARADYKDRVCPYFLASGTRILGDELHVICQCLTTKVVLDRFAVKFQRLTRVLDLPSLNTFSAEETTRLVIGNHPAQVLQKELRRWTQEATPLCGEYTYALCTYITSLQPAVVDMSSDDEDTESPYNNNNFSLILPPPGFQPVSIPPTNTMLAFRDPAGHQPIWYRILFILPTYGWCLGRISEWNSNPKRQACK